MTISKGRFRATPGAAGIAGQALQAYHDRPGDAAHGTVIAGWTATTGSDGEFDVTKDGSPGPHYWQNTTPYDGKTRKQSTRVGGQMGAVQLLELPYLLGAVGDGVGSGVLNRLAPSIQAGLVVRIETGMALIKGIEYVNHVLDDLTHAAADATNPRIDTIVVEVARAGQLDEGRAELKIVAGTPAASPVAPTLTQTAAVWQLPLVDVRINAASTTITSITDRRVFLLSPTTQARNPAVDVVARRTNTANVGIASGAAQNVPDLAAGPVLLAGGVYDIVAVASLLLRSGTDNPKVEMAPYIGGTENVATFLGHDIASQWIAITNTHTRLGVVGTGAALGCGVMVQRTRGEAASGQYNTGVLSVRCIPRS